MAIIGVMGSGTAEWDELAAPLGVWIARSGHDLLTGAGRGVMLAVARAFHGTPGRTGRSIGIVPTRPDAERGFVALDGYPNPYVDIPILTPLSRKEPGAPAGTLSRNHVNILTSDVVVALPGGQGTLDETQLALRFSRPVIGFGPAAEFRHTPPEVRVTGDLGEVTAFIADHAGRPAR